MIVAVDEKQVHWSPDHIVITFVVGEGEIVRIWLNGRWLDVPIAPVVIAQRRKESISICPGPITAHIGIDKIVVIGPYGRIDRRGLTQGVVVVAGSGDEIRVPALNEVRHVEFGLARTTKVANHGKSNRCRRRDNERATGTALVVGVVHRPDHCVAARIGRRRRAAVVGEVNRDSTGYRCRGRTLRRSIVGLVQTAQRHRCTGLVHG